ncbi:MAG: signal peptidase I [Acidobacteriaceae bacterium]|nr:signal peptidase I [Acidobacteriaceae bacterium]
MRLTWVPASPLTNLLAAAQSLLVLIVIAVFIVTFAAQPFRIPSGSMEPTLMIGDFLLVDKQVASTDQANYLLPPAPIRHGEIVVFHYPVDPSMHLIKRVVGLPGDHLRLRDGHLYVNGAPVSEPYAMYLPSGADNFRDNFPRLQNADPNIDSHWWIRMRRLIDNGELIVPEDCYFVLGDNRNQSEDSRYWGFVPREAIVGSPVVIYFSLRQGAPAAAVQHESKASLLDAVFDFARWDRIMRIVR